MWDRARLHSIGEAEVELNLKPVEAIERKKRRGDVGREWKERKSKGNKGGGCEGPPSSHPCLAESGRLQPICPHPWVKEIDKALSLSTE